MALHPFTTVPPEGFSHGWGIDELGNRDTKRVRVVRRNAQSRTRTFEEARYFGVGIDCGDDRS
jgi:hypothetical protein